MSSILTDSNLSLALHSNHDISRKQAVADSPDVSRGMCHQIRHDPIYRRKFINTLCLYASFLAMSFARGQIGPSFLDLQAISGVGLKGGSGLLTTMYIGYMAGAVLGGMLYDKFKRSLLLAFSKFILACAAVAIPWCSMYWLMVMAFFFLGATVGVTDAICNAQLQFIWGKDGRRFMQCLHFMYSFGVALTPLITIAFLEEAPDSVTSEGQSKFLHPHNNSVLNFTSILNTSGEIFISQQLNISQNGSNMSHTDTEFVRSPELYKAYVITGCVIMAVFAMQIGFYLRYDRKSTIAKKGPQNVTAMKSRLPLSIKIHAILNMAGILALICGIDDTLVSFLATFCVKEFGWTKTDGSLLTSLTCFIVVIGRFLGIFLVGIMSPVTLVGLHSVLTALVFIGIYICVLFKSSTGFWIVMPIFGYAKAPIFACIFTWTDEVFVQVTGKVASLFFIVITASQALNPLILGFLMDNFTNVWFCYLFLGESVLLVFLFFTAFLLTKRVKRLYGTNHETLAVEVKVAENLLEKKT